MEGDNVSIIAATKRIVFVTVEVGDDSFVLKCLDAITGELKNSLRSTRSIISNARKELYTPSPSDEVTGTALRSFFWEEPLL